jgi:hypothetical protein
MTELNPNHPTTQMLSDQWAKIAAILIRKMDTRHVIITAEDITELSNTSSNIAVQELEDGLHLRLVDDVTAKRLAAENGGLPN